jgi:hypothetical protein
MRSKLFYISKLKKLNDLDSNEAFDLQRRTVNSIVSRVGEAGRVFVTDLKMKWTCWALPKMSDMDYKVIYIERPKEDTVNSFLKRHRLRLKRRGSKHFRSFLKGLRQRSFFDPTDRCVLNRINIDGFSLYTDGRPDFDKLRFFLEFYWEETRSQWERFKKLYPDNTLEVAFAELTDARCLEYIGRFIGMRPDLSRMEKKVNLKPKGC